MTSLCSLPCFYRSHSPLLSATHSIVDVPHGSSKRRIRWSVLPPLLRGVLTLPNTTPENVFKVFLSWKEEEEEEEEEVNTDGAPIATCRQNCRPIRPLVLTRHIAVCRGRSINRIVWEWECADNGNEQHGDSNGICYHDDIFLARLSVTLPLLICAFGCCFVYWLSLCL